MIDDSPMTSRRNLLHLATAGIATSASLKGSAQAQDALANQAGQALPSSPDLRSPSGLTTVSAADFGAVGDGRTDDTAAIQAALDSGASAVILPSGRATRRYLFSNLVVPFRVRLTGGGARGSVLYQTDRATGAALTFERGLPAYGAPADISDGGYDLENIGLDVASEVGLRINGGATASMFGSHRFRLVHRHHVTLQTRPYSTARGSVGIEVDGGWDRGHPGDDAAPVYMADHVLGEIRGFETAVRASGTVNEWNFRSFWLLDNKVAFDLTDVSTWFINATVESGVKGARAFVLRGAISNLVVESGRWELTQPDSYGLEFTEGLSAMNIAVRNANVIIEGDGSGLPGRKWLGRAPASMVMEGSYVDPVEQSDRYFCIAPSQTSVRLPSHIHLGGQNLGDGRIDFGRDHDNGAISTLKHDGSTLTADSPNGFRVAQPGAGQAWRQPLLLGDHCLWVDRAGRLRIKGGYPANDQDGAVVGSQS